MRRAFWAGKRVFLTGHTGFKGGWLSLWLADMGAAVHGYALPPASTEGLFARARLAEMLASHTLADIRDEKRLEKALRRAAPELVLHLAAQPLVSRARREPVETIDVNVLGTVRLLEALRRTPGVRAAVIVTSDKGYAPRGAEPHRETDPLGGDEPYAGSKACVEILAAVWRDAYLRDAGVALATARAGNVVGGGDVAEDRLVPDFFRALARREALVVRRPDAVRPWQHVLDPLAGYLDLSERLFEDGAAFAEAWNFGPGAEGERPVRDVLSLLASRAGGLPWRVEERPDLPETPALRLDATKARERLGWRPRWRLEEALAATATWWAEAATGADVRPLSRGQIRAFEASVGRA